MRDVRRTRLSAAWLVVVALVSLNLIVAPPIALARPVPGQLLIGWLTVLHGDHPTPTPGPHRQRVQLIDDQGEAIELQLDPATAHNYNGRRVEVTIEGSEPATADGTVRATARSLRAVAQPAGSPTTPAGLVSGAQPWLTILCRFADSPTITPLPVSYFNELMGGNAPALDHYWRQISSQTISIKGSSVVGWLNLPRPRSAYVFGNGAGQLNFQRLAADCTRAADAVAFFPRYVGINLVFNQNLDCCAWGGLTYLNRDGVGKLYRITYLPPWAAANQNAFAHEMGHGVGFPHSGNPATQASNWDGDGTCQPPHPTFGCIAAGRIGYHLDLVGWLPGQRKVIVAPGQTVALQLDRLQQPWPASDRPLLAQVTIDGSRFYTVESRRAVGYDTALPGEAVLIHEVNLSRWLLQTNPAWPVDADGDANPNDAGAQWTPGEVYVDEQRDIHIAVIAQEGTGHIVAISNRNGPLDRTPPSIASLTPPPGAITNQRVGLIVEASDPPSPSADQPIAGITAYEYSLDGTHYVTARTLAASAEPGPQTIEVDLAHPLAGGNWQSGSRPVYLRVRDGHGNASPAVMTTLSLTLPTLTTRYLPEGYTGAGFDVYLTLANPADVPAVTSLLFQYAGPSSGPPGLLLTIPPGQRRTLSINQLVGPDHELSLKVESDQPVVAERPIYFTGYGAAGPATIDGGHLGVAASAPADDWYFAEGYTGDGFDVFLTIQNPQSVDAAVLITYYFTDGSTSQHPLTVGAGRRRTVTVHGPEAAQAGIGRQRTFSARVGTTNGQPIVAERVVYFRYNQTITGGLATLGATAPATSWFFAEGYTGPGFDQYLTIQNPNPSPDQATITYFIEGQSQPTERQVPLPANSRTTIAVHAPPSATNPGGLGRNLAVASRITSTLPIVAERPIYFRYTAGTLIGIDGGHNVMGATATLAAGQRVVMAEGYTGEGFHQYLTLQNPGAEPAQLALTYLPADGGPAVNRSLTLPPRQRTTVAVHQADDPTGAGLGPGRTFATSLRVVSAPAEGVLAERVMYFRFASQATGGSAAFGTLIP